MTNEETQLRLAYVHAEVEAALSGLVHLFAEGVSINFIAYIPGDTDSTIFVGNSEPEQLAGVVTAMTEWAAAGEGCK